MKFFRKSTRAFVLVVTLKRFWYTPHDLFNTQGKYEANQADKIVLSLDETARQCFREIAPLIRLLAFIVWVNPYIAEEMALDWLPNGTELEMERCLGYRKEEHMN